MYHIIGGLFNVNVFCGQMLEDAERTCILFLGVSTNEMIHIYYSIPHRFAGCLFS